MSDSFQPPETAGARSDWNAMSFVQGNIAGRATGGEGVLPRAESANTRAVPTQLVEPPGDALAVSYPSDDELVSGGASVVLRRPRPECS